VCVGFFVTLWSNHVALAPQASRSRLAALAVHFIRDTALLLVWIVVVGLPIAVVTPTYQCYTDRAKAAEVVLAGSVLRSQVEDAARARGTINGAGANIQFAPSGRVVAGRVTDDGEIVAIGEDPPVVIILSPAYVGGRVSWKCRGFPRKIVPMMCREEGES
jgi:hypothetical protein